MLLLRVCHIWLCVESKRCSRENQLYSMRLTQYKSHIFKWIVNDVKKVFSTSGKKFFFQLCDAHGKNWNMSINIDFKLKNHWWIIFFFSLINSSNDVVSDEMKNEYSIVRMYSNVVQSALSFVYVIMMIVMLYAVVYNVMPFRGGFILFFYFILLVICQWRTATLF